MATPRLDVSHTALLVVDVQEKLLPHMHDAPGVLTQVGRLVEGVHLLGLPVIVTEQYVKGLGPTHADLAARLPASRQVYEKMTFSAYTDPVRHALQTAQARSVLVCGIEAHVCVLQTCLDLADAGFLPFVVTDAVSSRKPVDAATAIQRLIQAHVVPTTVESALLEMTRQAGTPTFKAMLPLIK